MIADSHPNDEYIITEKELEDYQQWAVKCGYEIQALFHWSDIRSRPYSSARSGQLKFNSTELLLLAHDEWKRRDERKHNHDPQAWRAGFINGFLTDWKWARERIDKIQREAGLRKQGEQR